MPYITNSNVNKMIRDRESCSADLSGDFYKNNRFLFLNKFEKRILLATKNLFGDPDEFFKLRFEKQKKHKDSYMYVYEYEGQAPAYHKTNSCPRLLSSYKKFEIPLQIKKKGEKEVLEFRKWFKEREELLENNPKKFLEFLQVTWNIPVTESYLKGLEFSNTGSSKSIENINLDTLESVLDNLILKANNFIVQTNKNQTILDKYVTRSYKYKNKEPLEYNDTGYSDEEIKKILKVFEIGFKKPLAKNLKVYYRVKFNPKLEFKEDLLSQIGFVPCQECYHHIVELPFDLLEIKKATAKLKSKVS